MQGQKSLRLSFGVSNEDAWSVGLSCGGSIQVFMERINLKDKLWVKLMRNLKNNQSSVLVSSLEDGGSKTSLISLEHDDQVIGEQLSDELLREAKQAYGDRNHRSVIFNEIEYFIQVFARKPLLLVIGAAHITVELVLMAKQFEFKVVVIDPRGFFAKNTSFAVEPDEIIEAYPSEVLENFPLDSYTFAAILSHDPKIDDDALSILLPRSIGYIGALGSKKTHSKRIARLLDRGMSQEQIDTIYAPIGESINARSAKEIALSIISQIIKVKNHFYMKKHT